MKQIIQNYRTGDLECDAVSSGTKMTIIEMGKTKLIGKVEGHVF